MGHTHTWIPLDIGHIDIIRQRVDTPKTQSLYLIVKICRDHGCSAGVTGDGVVFENIRQGTVQEDEVMLRVTSGLKTHTKEGR